MKMNVFIKNYTKVLKSGNAAIFAGAGFSKSAGFVDWATLLTDVADELDLDSNKEVGSLPELAQFPNTTIIRIIINFLRYTI